MFFYLTYILLLFLKPSLYEFSGSENLFADFLLTPDHPFLPNIKVNIFIIF